MITLRIRQAFQKEQLDRLGKDADYYIKRRVLDKFCEEFIKHIEPRDIEIMRNFGTEEIIFTFDIKGGSLPEHMEHDL